MVRPGHENSSVSFCVTFGFVAPRRKPQPLCRDRSGTYDRVAGPGRNDIRKTEAARPRDGSQVWRGHPVEAISVGLARQRLDHGKASFGRATHHVDSPFLGILARDDVLTQGWKSLSFQLFQDRSKSCSNHCIGVTDKYDQKTGCKQIATYFVRRDKETDVGCGSPWQRIVGLSRWAGAGEGQGEQSARAKHPERFAKDAQLV